MKKNYPTCVMFDNTTLPSKEDYKECLDENFDGEEMVSYDIYVSSIQEIEYEDFESNLKHSSMANAPCVLYGSVGTWQGRREIANYYFGNMLDAFKKCADNAEYIKVTLENGVLNVNVYHHDGTNCFTIQPLSKKGKSIL